MLRLVFFLEALADWLAQDSCILVRQVQVLEHMTVLEQVPEHMMVLEQVPEHMMALEQVLEHMMVLEQVPEHMTVLEQVPERNLGKVVQAHNKQLWGCREV